jgi:hypothetical protein
LDFTGALANHLPTAVNALDSLDLTEHDGSKTSAIFGFTFSTRDSRLGSEWNRGQAVYRAVKVLTEAAAARGMSMTGLGGEGMSDYVMFSSESGKQPIKVLAQKVYAWGQKAELEGLPGKLPGLAVKAAQFFIDDKAALVLGLVQNVSKDRDLAVVDGDGAMHDATYRRLKKVAHNIAAIDPEFSFYTCFGRDDSQVRVLRGCVHMYVGQMTTLLFRVN